MKVYIGPYTKWLGPYQLAEKILFWKDKHSGAVDRLGDFFSETWVGTFLEKMHKLKKRKIKVRIDHYDVWGADHTLALIIIPTLKRLKQVKHGSPHVDLEDVPEHLHSDENEDNFHKRWEYVLDEMIWAFEQIILDEDGEADHNYYDPLPAGQPIIKAGVKDGFFHTGNELGVFNRERYLAYNYRIQKGLIFFGKYYRSLWD